ncbi:MAG: choice-of-anchor L domain-containing protein [Polyangiales bacterium]
MRRYLVPVLLSLLACDDDDARGVVTLDSAVVGPSMDAFVNPDQDATCATSTLTDFDDDGFTRTWGDCNDCDRNIGPAAYDFPGNGIDEDCDGRDATLVDQICDTTLDDDDLEPLDAMRAFGLCGPRNSAASGRQGLNAVSLLRLDASKQGLADPRQLWLPERFGQILPREGARMLVLSTGVARDSKARDYTPECDVFGGMLDTGSAWAGGVPPPKGFPRDSRACGNKPISTGALAYDDVVVELELRAPFNASAFSFDSMFLTYEYPDFVCSQYNDFFVVLMDPAPDQADDNDNILFDANEDAIGVNSALLSVCETAEPRRVARTIACEQGKDLLKDTGYGAKEATCGAPRNGKDLGGAATGWLHTEMPVRAGRTFTLRFVLWDSGDPLLDSTVLLDNFRWLNTAPSGNTVPISSR